MARPGTGSDKPTGSRETGVAGMSDDDLTRARTAYRGALDSARAWRAFTEETRHHDVTYWSLLCSLFVEPGLNRMRLIDKVIDYAGVSRSTAERAIREARRSDYIVDRRHGKEVRFYLSESMLSHCVDYFRRYMDFDQVLINLGYKQP